MLNSLLYLVNCIGILTGMNRLANQNSYTVSLADLPTWQSGILQASMQRSMKKLTDDYLKQFDLSTTHWLIIGAIWGAGPKGIRLTDLAEQVGTTLGYLTTALNTLEAKQMVIRSSQTDDNRTKLITIQPSYKRKCQKIEAGLRDVFRHALYKHIDRDDLETYVKVTQKLSRIS